MHSLWFMLMISSVGCLGAIWLLSYGLDRLLFVKDGSGGVEPNFYPPAPEYIKKDK